MKEEVQTLAFSWEAHTIRHKCDYDLINWAEVGCGQTIHGSDRLARLRSGRWSLQIPLLQKGQLFSHSLFFLPHPSHFNSIPPHTSPIKNTQHSLSLTQLLAQLTAMSNLQHPPAGTPTSNVLDGDSVLNLLQELLPAHPSQAAAATTTETETSASTDNQQETTSSSSPAATTTLLKSEYEGLASLSHAIMTAVGFRLIGLGEEDSVEAERRNVDGKPPPFPFITR